MSVAGQARELARFDAERFRPSVIFESDAMKVVLAALEPGQAVDLHDPPVDVVIAVLEGQADVWIGDAPRRLRPGEVAVVPAGETRGMRAAGVRTILLHVAAPPPTDEVLAGVAHRPWPEPERGTEDAAERIHAEHHELLPHLDHLDALADAAPDLPEQELRGRLAAVLSFLQDVLLPHAGAEDGALYPAVERLLRATGGATRTMSEDHRAIAALIEELAALAGREEIPRRDLQRALDRLAGLVRVHFRKEEEAYVPLLRLLTAGEARELLEALPAAGHGHGH
ncbi:MAG TPA: hemerythrin domain-containing protein [Actinomycetota bacterium]|nr:hemerythrin domain-containing protein [Actinomycetota bacterium]